ncbi:ABC transporter ATP-binding protein [Pseudonocardia sp. CA-107938]|uniref:ABC transporter ATP-binding protein n=1 Tax=Pseudonocardia sp. CA-107938 TaxID=3240021 RepID=UPI003D946BD2
MTATTVRPPTEAPPVAAPPVRADRLLVDAVRQGGWWVLLMVVAHAGVAVSTLLLPTALAAALDAVLAPGTSTGALPLFALLVVAAVGAAFLLELAQPYAATAATRWLRGRLVDRVLAAGVAGRRRFDTGDLITRLGSNTATAAAAGSVVLSSVVGLVTSGGAIVALFLLDPLVGGLFVVGVPIGFVVLTYFVRQSSDLYGRYQALQGRIAGRFVDAMAGIRTIRSAGTADREVRRVLAPLPELSAAGRGIWRMQGMVTWRIQVLAPFMEIGVLMLVGWLVTTGRLTPGDLVAAAAYTTLGLRFFDQGSLLIGLSRSRAAARRAAEVLGDPDADPKPGASALPDRGGELQLRGVTVRVAERVLLDAVDVRVPAGAVVALVGHSGSGKSTLGAVAGRLIDPDAGSVQLDGVELRDLDPAALRRAIGIAFAHPVLLGTTVLDALGYGCPDARRADLVAAATAAHADGFIRRLPGGYDTPIADAPFSGGEAQRLGLARAVARRGRLLIMDDATSSLDTVTEAQVVDAITTALAGRSRLVVAHRTSTAARADHVVWLDEGRVRRAGRHADLWHDPAYRAVFGVTGGAG